jgi:hypothetical protein
MKKQTYTKTEIRSGYIFNGTLECAKEIFNAIQSIEKSYATPFKLNYNLHNDSVEFEWGGYEIQKGDFIAIIEEHNKHLFQHPIEVITQKELTRWGYVPD